MSTWISKLRQRAGLSLVALLTLAGCMDATLGGGVNRVTVAGGDIVIAGPEGYCIDRSATRNAPDNSFALLASCAAVTRVATAPAPRVSGVLMASVAAADGGVPVANSLNTLRRFFRSEAGRAALSQSGDARTVRVLETASADGVFYIHARDSSAGLAEEVRDEYWRALFDVKGRLVSASVFGTDARPFSTDAGRALLGRFVAHIRAANAPAG